MRRRGSSLALLPLLLATHAAFAQEPLDAGTPAETVVVGTPLGRTAGSAQVLKASRLTRLNLDDAHAVLQQVPGVYARGEDGFGLRPNIGLRGASSDRSKKVTLLEDGVLLGPAPYSAPAAYYLPLVGRMVSVRVLKGPAAIQYGPQTVGGAIDFVTRDVPVALSGAGQLAAGSYGTMKLLGWLGAGDEHGGFLVDVAHLGTQGFKRLDGGGDTGFSRTDLLLKARAEARVGGARHRFELKTGLSLERSNETYLGLTDADFAVDGLRRYAASKDDVMTWQRLQLALTHRVEVGLVELTTTAYRHDLGRTWNKVNRFRGADLAAVLANPSNPRNELFAQALRGEADAATPAEALLIGPNRRVYVSQGVQTQLRARFNTGPLTHALEAQLRYHFDSIDRRHSESAYALIGGSPERLDEPEQLTASGQDATHAVALYATDALGLGPVTLTPGLRTELIASTSTDRLAATQSNAWTAVLLPGIGAHWQIIEPLGVFAGAYRGFSPPTPGQQAAQPELSFNVEAGARWGRRGEKLELLGFFNDYANLTSTCTFSSGCHEQDLDRQLNAGQAMIGGLEVLAEKTFFFKGISVPLTATYTLTKTQLLGNFTSTDPTLGRVRPGDELPYVPAHQLALGAGVDTQRFSLHAQLSFIDAMRERAGQGEADPQDLTHAVATLDARLQISVTEQLRLTLDARNLFDTRAIVSRRPFGARPNAPRTILAGLSFQY